MPQPLSRLPMLSSRLIKTCVLAMALAAFAIAVACFGPYGASAQDKADKSACEQFTWSIKREQALFADPNLKTVFSGATLSELPLRGVALELQPHAAVEYVLHPGREPKTPESNGGILSISNNPKAGRYQVTLSGEAWLDII